LFVLFCLSFLVLSSFFVLCGCGLFDVRFFWVDFCVWVVFWGLLGCGSGFGLHFSAWVHVGLVWLWVWGMLKFFGCEGGKKRFVVVYLDVGVGCDDVEKFGVCIIGSYV
jgi:hypothetical protein